MIEQVILTRDEYLALKSKADLADKAFPGIDQDPTDGNRQADEPNAYKTLERVSKHVSSKDFLARIVRLLEDCYPQFTFRITSSTSPPPVPLSPPSSSTPNFEGNSYQDG